MNDERQYPCECQRDGEIDVVFSGDLRAALAAGKAIQFYEFDFRSAIDRLQGRFPGCEYWYTERNGDPISMVVPAGTPNERLPSTAMTYAALEWIKHDKDFGSGVVPMKWRRAA